MRAARMFRRAGGRPATAGSWLAMIAGVLLGAVAPAVASAVPSDHPITLQRGINLTGWFRFPASLNAIALRRWIDDDAIVALHRVGFGFVRLAVDPAILSVAGVPGRWLRRSAACSMSAWP